MKNYLVSVEDCMGGYSVVWTGEAESIENDTELFLAENPDYDGEISVVQFAVVDSKSVVIENGKALG